MSERLWDEVEYVQPLNGDAPYWAVFDLGSVIGVKSTRYVRGDLVHALRAEMATAERRGAELALRERIAAMSVADCQILESRILQINADVPYIASEEGFAARIRDAVRAVLFPATPEPL